MTTGGDPQEPNDHDEPMTEARARERLASVHTEKLDAFRASMTGRRTSFLICVIAGVDDVLDRMLDELGMTADANPSEDDQMVLLAAAVAAADEIDARIPAWRHIGECCPACAAPISTHPLADSCTKCNWVRVKVGGR